MLQIVKDYFWIIDFSISLFILCVICVLYYKKYISYFIWLLFWAGVLTGFIWEITLTLIDVFNIANIFIFNLKPPVHYIFIVISHSLWDGSLFIIGVGIIYLFLNKPHFISFKFSEILILIIWSQIQSIIIEIISIQSGGWMYKPLWWNPVLLFIKDKPVTLLPQFIWLIGCIIFYSTALLIHKSLYKQFTVFSPQNKWQIFIILDPEIDIKNSFMSKSPNKGIFICIITINRQHCKRN